MARTGCRPLIEDKWSLMTISFLGDGPRRFTELRRGLDGISQRMLTVTLRNLERDGILTRTVHNVMPPNISYALTQMGETLLAAAGPLIAWGAANVDSVESSRTAYDSREP